MHPCKSSTVTRLPRSPDLLHNTSPQQTQLHRRLLLSANSKRSWQVSSKPVDTLVKLSSLSHHSQQPSRAQVGTSATIYLPSAAHSAFAYSNRAKHTWNNAVSKAQKEQPPQSRRYIGVHRRGGKWGAAITEGGQQFFFGVYPTEDQAARAYDEGRIFLHKKPVNFSLSEYHVEEVRRHSTLEEFARQKRQAIKSAGRIILASRFQGVYARQGKWGACAYLQRQHFSLGGHRTEEEAAKAVDRALIYTAGHCTSSASICSVACIS